jgi:peptidoglycan hydrolase-like protein with peptidoglycan-binding domain
VHEVAVTSEVKTPDDHGSSADRDVPGPLPRRSRRVAFLAAGTVLILASGAAGYTAWAQPTDVVPEEPMQVATTPVTAGRMVSERSLVGTLQYSTKLPVVSGASGVITWLPKVGGTIAPGDVMFRMNIEPVVMLSGRLPAWRTFTSGMTDGDDIRQLERNLRSFGFFDGDPDRRFNWNTVVAVKRWQKSLGAKQTGKVARSMILFSNQDLRVDGLSTRVGAQLAAGATVYQATSRKMVADLEIQLDDRELAVRGGAVKVALPTGAEIKGVITTVGSPVVQPGEDENDSNVIVPVRITMADQKAVRDLALANVRVKFATTLKKDVLTVPVDALVPSDDTHFVIEVPKRGPNGERTMIPVTVGAFGSGRVEISGPGVTNGLSVVVPSR